MSFLFQPLLLAAEALAIPTLATAYWVGGSGTWDASDTTHWAATSGGSGGAGVPISTSNVIFDGNSGTGTVTIDGGVCNDLTVSGLSGAMVFNPISFNVYGNVTLPATNLTFTSSTDAITFKSTSGTKTITTNGMTIGCRLVFDGVGGTWELADNLTVSGQFTDLVNGTLDLNSKILATTAFNTSGLTTKTVTSASAATIKITSTGGGSVWSVGSPTWLTISDTITVEITSGGSGIFQNINIDVPINLKIGGNGVTLTIYNFGGTAANYIRNLTVTNTTCTINFGPSNIIYLFGNLLVEGSNPTITSSDILTFNSTSDTKTITTNGATIDCPVTFNGTGGRWQLEDNLTVGLGRRTTLVNGILDLNLKTFKTGTLISDSGTRSIVFAGGNITVTGPADTTGTYIYTLFRINAIVNPNITFLGTPIINVSYSTGTNSDFGNIEAFGLGETKALNLNVTTGVYRVGVSGDWKDINFTGYTGQAQNSNALNIYGNLTFGSGMTFSGGSNPTTFAATSGTKIITTNNVAYNTTVIFNGVGGSWQLFGTLDLGINTWGTATLQNGTVNLSGSTLKCLSFSTNTGTKNLTFNGGTVLCTGDGATVFNNAQPTNFTTTAGTGTGKISLNSSTAKTFIGGGSTYNCTLENAGAGALTISGDNTFTAISNSVQPTTFTFTSGSTQTVTNFNVSGTVGNLVTINSTTSGSPATLSKASGTVTVSYTAIKDSTATGGATWNAYTSNGNVDNGGNSGWIFAAMTAGYVKIYMGSGPGWVYKPVKTWDGTQWVIKPAKWYNTANTTWVPTSGL